VCFRTVLKEGSPCVDTTATVTLVGQTVVIDAVVKPYDTPCIYIAVPVLNISCIDSLPEGHYAVEVYRTEQPGPPPRELWATGEFDVAPTPTINETEPNNSFDRATAALPNTSISGQFDHPLDFDLFRVDAEVGERLTIDVEAERLDPPSSADPMVSVSNEQKTLGGRDNFGDSLDPLYDFFTGVGGSFWVRVHDRRGTSGPHARYRLNIRAAHALPESEPNNAFRQANAFRYLFWQAPTVFGDLNRDGDVDVFEFYGEKDQLIEIDVDARSLRRPSGASVIITLFDHEGQVLAEARGSEASPDPVLRFRAPSKGAFFFSLRNAVDGSSTNFRYDATLRLQ
jgi:hypothetical protein